MWRRSHRFRVDEWKWTERDLGIRLVKQQSEPIIELKRKTRL